MTYMDLQALRHYVYQVQKIIYETHCKAYDFCSDVYNTLAYINKKIKEREALELH